MHARILDFDDKKRLPKRNGAFMNFIYQQPLNFLLRESALEHSPDTIREREKTLKGLIRVWQYLAKLRLAILKPGPKPRLKKKIKSSHPQPLHSDQMDLKANNELHVYTYKCEE